MKFAVISDVHANPMALERVLADAEQCGVEQAICAGDVVGYGPNPATGEVQFRQVEFDFAGYKAALQAKSIPIPPWMEE